MKIAAVLLGMLGAYANRRIGLLIRRFFILAVMACGGLLGGAVIPPVTPALAQVTPSTCTFLHFGESQSCTRPEGFNAFGGTASIFSARDSDGNCLGGLSLSFDYGDGTVITFPITNPCGQTFTVPSHTYNVEEGQTLDVVISGSGNGIGSVAATWHVTFTEGDTFVVIPTSINASVGKQFSGVVARFQNTTWPEHNASNFTATIDWGDGSPIENASPSGSATIQVSGSHTYTKNPSSLQVIVTLTDPPPGTATAVAHTAIVAGCPVDPLDKTFLSDPVSAEFEQSAPNAPFDSLTIPFVDSGLRQAVEGLNFLAPASSPLFVVTSGYRPPAYQGHLRNLRDTWIRLMKLSPLEQFECADLIEEVDHEIRITHQLPPCTKCGNLPAGTPMVSAWSQHSTHPSVAVDLGPVDPLLAIPNLDELARSVGMWRPCKANGQREGKFHFSPLKTVCQQAGGGFADPPFNIIIEDPLGRRIGFNPVTQSVINEIGPEATYVGVDTDAQFIDIDPILPGRYVMNAVNVSPGPYSLSFFTMGEGPEPLEIQTISGVITSQNETIPPLVMTVPWDVVVDIKPNEFPNSINPRNRGNIPVAIFSTDAFDAPALVNSNSLSFGRTGNEKTGPSCYPEDVDGDGLPDLVCHFNTQGTGFQQGDTVGILKGTTLDGTPIIGSDSVNIVQ
jgi:hypothetical protein